MKYAIITPTFEPHFKYIAKYLKSFDTFVTDKDSIQVIFTISRPEKQSFSKIIKDYKHLNIMVLCFEEILSFFKIKETSEELLEKYKKFTFQTLKKFYTMLYVDADYFLVLDSESMWIRKTNMTYLFEQYYEKPFLTYSSPKDRERFDIFSSSVRKNTDFLLGQKCEKWFLENFVWFYDKKILIDMCEKVGYPIDLAQKIKDLNDTHRLEWGIFEIELYQVFVYLNNEKYHYRLIDAGKFLKESLPITDYTEYRATFMKKFDGGCGILERTMSLLTEANYKILGSFFKKNNFSVIRCEESNFENFDLQKKFVAIAQPNILAASQEHGFGVNKPFIILCKKNGNLRNAFFLFKDWIQPIKTFFTWLLLKPVKITYYTLRFGASVMKHHKLFTPPPCQINSSYIILSYNTNMVA